MFFGLYTKLEKVSFHSNPKERQWQRMLKLLHSCTHLTHRKHSQEELPHVQGQGHQLRVPGCNGAGVAKRSYPTSEGEAAAKRSYPTSKVRGSGKNKFKNLLLYVAF